MTQRTRKFVGILLLLGTLIVWAIAAGAIYANVLGSAPQWLLLIYFAIVGMGWFFPAAWVIRWMAKPD